MRWFINLKQLITIALTASLLWGCEPFYNPVNNHDVPTSPGVAWTEKPIVYKKTAELPFDASDLSGTMSLPRLLDIALYNNPSTRASWNAARAAAYAYHAALSPYYPSLEYSGSLDAQTNKGSSFASSASGIVATSTTTTQTFRTFQVNELSLSYLLLDFGGRNAAAEYALQTLYASNWTHDYTMQQVMLSLLNAYTSYIGNKGLVNAYEQNLKDAQVALDSAQVMRTAGLATLSDVLLAQSTLEQTRTTLIQAQGAEKTAFGGILIAIGLPPDTELSIQDLPDKLPVIEISGNLSTLIELAKERNPELGVAITAIKQQEAQLALSYSNSMPTLSANAFWDQVIFISPKMPPGYNETAFLQLNFPIFQGFYYMNQQRQYRAQIQEALANLDVQLATISSEIVTNYYAYTSAAAALESARAAVLSSQRAFRGFVVQYKTGSASILDILTALTTLSSARGQEILLRTQWAAALANLAVSVGVLDATNGEWDAAPPEQLYQLPIRDDDVPQRE